MKLLMPRREQESYVKTQHAVLAVQNVLSGSGHAGRLRLMGKYTGHRLVDI